MRQPSMRQHSLPIGGGHVDLSMTDQAQQINGPGRQKQTSHLVRLVVAYDSVTNNNRVESNAAYLCEIHKRLVHR